MKKLLFGLSLVAIGYTLVRVYKSHKKIKVSDIDDTFEQNLGVGA